MHAESDPWAGAPARVGIDAPEASAARVRAYEAPAAVLQTARGAATLVSFERGVSIVFGAICRHSPHAGTTYPDAPLRYSHEVQAAAARLLTSERLRSIASARHRAKPGSAAARRLEQKERAELIRALSLPADGGTAETRLAASTGELYGWYMEATGDFYHD